MKLFSDDWTVATDNSESRFEKALREEKSGPELASAFTGFNYGLLTRLNDVEGRLSKTIIEQASAGRHALAVSGFTFTVLAAFVIYAFTSLNSMNREIGSLNTLTNRISNDLSALENTVSGMQEQVNEVLATVRTIDERTREMADRAEVNPDMLAVDPDMLAATPDMLAARPDILASQELHGAIIVDGVRYVIDTDIKPSPRLIEDDMWSGLPGFSTSDATTLARTLRNIGFTAMPLSELVSPEKIHSKSLERQLVELLEMHSDLHLVMGAESAGGFAIKRQPHDEIISRIKLMSEHDIETLINQIAYVDFPEDSSLLEDSPLLEGLVSGQ